MVYLSVHLSFLFLGDPNRARTARHQHCEDAGRVDPRPDAQRRLREPVLDAIDRIRCSCCEVTDVETPR